MAQQALYQNIVESQIFFTQAEASQWGSEKKAEYQSAGMVVKVDINPVDATRRRWKADWFLKV